MLQTKEQDKNPQLWEWTCSLEGKMWRETRGEEGWDWVILPPTEVKLMYPLARSFQDLIFQWENQDTQDIRTDYFWYIRTYSNKWTLTPKLSSREAMHIYSKAAAKTSLEFLSRSWIDFWAVQRNQPCFSLSEVQFECLLYSPDLIRPFKNQNHFPKVTTGLQGGQSPLQLWPCLWKSQPPSSGRISFYTQTSPPVEVSATSL